MGTPLDAYFNFFDTHATAVFRSFFVLLLGIDLVFLYAVAFDRDLPRRVAIRFFGALSGQSVTMPPTDETIRWWQWLVYIFISAVPPALWLFFELYCANRAG
jgi:hypothetical protein